MSARYLVGASMLAVGTIAIVFPLGFGVMKPRGSHSTIACGAGHVSQMLGRLAAAWAGDCHAGNIQAAALRSKKQPGG
ncbi:MAG: hypothetical protein U0975_10560 [Erythrobacter sp.]|nr:hypothetical protein [Erythrobacter sp.]